MVVNYIELKNKTNQNTSLKNGKKKSLTKNILWCRSCLYVWVTQAWSYRSWSYIWILSQHTLSDILIYLHYPAHSQLHHLSFILRIMLQNITYLNILWAFSHILWICITFHLNFHRNTATAYQIWSILVQINRTLKCFVSTEILVHVLCS